MKIVNGEKAKLLLTDPKSFPALMIGDVILNAPEATKSQKMRFENNATMYIMYSNSGNVVTQGKPVTILFGDTALQPIEAK
jgi:predicted phage tail protein